MNIGELKQHLESYSDDTPCAYALWLSDDVIHAAEVNELPIPDAAECAAALNDIQRHHDTDNGITWEHVLRSLQSIVGEED